MSQHTRHHLHRPVQLVRRTWGGFGTDRSRPTSGRPSGVLDLVLACTDRPAALLTAVVVDPLRGCVTHVIAVVAGDPEDRRLVPVGAIDAIDSTNDPSPVDAPVEQPGSRGRVLHCLPEVLDAAPHVAEHQFVRIERSVSSPPWTLGVDQVLAWPWYHATFEHDTADAGDLMVTAPTPAATADVRRGDDVVSAAGFPVGSVAGFVCGDEGHVSHLLLMPGHQFGERDLAIPVAVLRRSGAGRVRVGLSRDAIAALPAVAVRRWEP